MRASVFGLGYVGCISAACLANDAHDVIGVDVNPHKVEMLRAGQSPVVEPGLYDIIQKVIKGGQLRVTLDSQMAVHDSDISLVCVGTPSNLNGSLQLDFVTNVCREIGVALATKQARHTVVIRSTVLPGTVEETLIPILEETSGKRAGLDFGICMNPEFLREGSSIHDYYHPSFVVIGAIDKCSSDTVEMLYQAVQSPVIHTSIRVAEMVKYACNAFHATKVVFANEIGNLCKAHGIDGREVMNVFCRDLQLNISPAYLKPGYAFGGSCLPKDTRALQYRAKEKDLSLPLLEAILVSNELQIRRGIEMVEHLGRKRVGVLGLSFKSDTDDVRESPVVPLIEHLVGKGYQVRIYDEKVELSRLMGANKAFLEHEIPHIISLMSSSLDDVLAHAEVIVVSNNSHTFLTVSEQLRAEQILVDLVGISGIDTGIGVTYEGICW